MSDVRCEHTDFIAKVDVDRLSEHEGSDVSAYMATVTVACAACGESFGFRGPPVGVSFTEPRCSPDAREIRLPLMDPSEQALNGPLPAVRRGPMRFETTP